jgi:hypothetical protein
LWWFGAIPVDFTLRALLCLQTGILGTARAARNVRVVG